jgi:hypothetical protein
VTLRIYCDVGVPPSPLFVTDDLYLECADESYNFEKSDLYWNEGMRYLCTTSAIFRVGSSYSSKSAIPGVAIITDESWLTTANQSCYTSSASIPTSSIPAPTLSVASAPVPLATPSSKPEKSPILLRETPKSVSYDSASLFGAVAGGFVGGIVVCLLILYFLKYRKNNNEQASGLKTNVADGENVGEFSGINDQNGDVAIT